MVSLSCNSPQQLSLAIAAAIAGDLKLWAKVLQSAHSPEKSSRGITGASGAVARGLAVGSPNRCDCFSGASPDYSSDYLLLLGSLLWHYQRRSFSSPLAPNYSGDSISSLYILCLAPFSPMHSRLPPPEFLVGLQTLYRISLWVCFFSSALFRQTWDFNSACMQHALGSVFPCLCVRACFTWCLVLLTCLVGL
jgi:hypothetical protein